MMKFLGALLCGVAGGVTFYYFNLPLAWMLGAMTACAIAALLHLPVAMPEHVRAPMTATIGTMLGSSFRPEILASVPHWIVPLLGMVGFLLVSGTISYLYFSRIAGLDRVTAYFSAMPGGLVDMIILGRERGGDERSIALSHAARIFLVVMSLPLLIQLSAGITLSARSGTYRPWSVLQIDGAFWFLFAAIGGVLLGRLLRLPARSLIGPMLVSAALHGGGVTDFLLPSAAISAAQVVLGAAVGCRFVGTAPRLILKTLATSAGATAILLSVTFIFAEGVAFISDVPLEALLLAYSPGGLTEMSLIALTLGLEVPLVVAHHMARVFLVIGGSAIFFRLVNRWDARPQAATRKR